MDKETRVRKKKKSEFIDDEAELSGEDASSDELEFSDDDDKFDTELVDLDAKELASDEEEDIRRLYHKQLATEDRRTILLMQEQMEENEITAGSTRRRKFRWQTKRLMENSLRRHYDPDDDDSQDPDDDDDEVDYSELQPRLRRLNAESLLTGSPRRTRANLGPRTYSKSGEALNDEPVAGPSSAMSEDSSSNLMNARGAALRQTTTTSSDLNRFIFRDKELVEALSTKETIIVSREEKDRNIQRELKRVLQSKSIFDQLYS